VLGGPRDLTLGLTFVDGSGAIVSAGGRVVKNVAGFDLTRAMIGSWGSLGVITSASLRLRSLPQAREAWALAAGSFEATSLERFVAGPFAVVAREVVAGNRARALGLPDARHVVVWLAGSLAHMQATRVALAEIGGAFELAPDSWRALRAYGPLSPSREPEPMSPELAQLNERVRAAFDPYSVFAAPAIWTRTQHVGVAARV
jgi:FAD/FMN-containing dehydrogenase